MNGPYEKTDGRWLVPPMRPMPPRSWSYSGVRLTIPAREYILAHGGTITPDGDGDNSVVLDFYPRAPLVQVWIGVRAMGAGRSPDAMRLQSEPPFPGEYHASE